MYNFKIKGIEESYNNIERYFNDFQNNMVKVFNPHVTYDDNTTGLKDIKIVLSDLQEFIKYYKTENQRYKDVLSFYIQGIQTYHLITITFGYFFTLKAIDFLKDYKKNIFQLSLDQLDIKAIVSDCFSDIKYNYQEALINEDVSCSKKETK